MCFVNLIEREKEREVEWGGGEKNRERILRIGGGVG